MFCEVMQQKKNTFVRESQENSGKTQQKSFFFFAQLLEIQERGSKLAYGK